MEGNRARPLDTAGSLRGQRIFITGATGFIGRVLVEKLLWSVPDVEKLLLLIRPRDQGGAARRLRRELLDSPLMARLRALHGGDWESWAAARIEAVEGDLAQPRFGLGDERYGALCTGIDRVIAAAATVRFDERLDRALELNARGALRTLELARDAGDVPLLHLSTCYVSGARRGTIPESIESEAGTADPTAMLAELEQASRLARPESEADLVRAGAELAASHGFHDVYTLTKALGERLVSDQRGRVPVAVLRPAIVESAAAEPIAGWIDSVKVADPLLVAYGRGRMRQVPGDPRARLELIPVDHVVNAGLAALAALEPGDDGLHVYQVGSARNPITLGELLSHAREGFAASPLRDEDDRPLRPAPARFVDPDTLRGRLATRRRLVGLAAVALRRAAGSSLAGLAGRLARAQRRLEHFERLLDVYGPYLGHHASYRDDRTRGLWRRLTDGSRRAFPFDVTAIDWRAYVAGVHVPGVVRFALRAESGAPPDGSPRQPRWRRQRRAEELARAATSVHDLFTRAARETPDAVAFQTFRDGRWLRYTYAQALETSANVAARLARDHGIGRGDRLVVWASGRPEWVLTTLAAHRLGAVTVPLDPQWPSDEVAAAAELTGARLICAAPELARLAPAGGVPVVELAEPFVPAPDVGALPGSAAPPAEVGPTDLATIVFTSGTTVSPKAVPLTHGNLLANVSDLVPLMHLSRDRLLSVLPIHHVFELMVGLLVPVAGGCTISYLAEIKPAEINWMMGVTRPTVLVAVPRLLELLHDGIRRGVAAGGPALGALFKLLRGLSRLTGGRLGHRLFGKVHRRFGGSLRRIVSGGAALEPGLARSFQLMGFEVAEGYGMTETSPVLTVNPWGEVRLGSAGRPLPGVEVEIRPAAATEGSGDGSGEIWVRGANVMAGYLDNPEATAAVMDGGWLDTGDLGRLDDDGYLHISGRSKEVIVTAAGKNVYPEEVELRYRALAGVEELIVLGLPSIDGRGELVGAVVVPSAEDGDESIRAAIDERSRRMPTYQRISRVEIWRGEIPKTTTLKVQRGRLREAVLGARTADPAGEPRRPRPAGRQSSAWEPTNEAEAWVVATLARLTRSRAELLTPATRLGEIGVDSLTRVELMGEIEARFGVRLDDAEAGSAGRLGELLELTRAAVVAPDGPQLG